MNYDYIPRITACPICKEEFLVEQFSFGIDHTAAIIVYHKGCVKLPCPEQFVLDHPDAAKMITDWITLPKEEFEKKQDELKQQRLQEMMAKMNIEPDEQGE